MIDLHSHILPGIDDGAENVDMSIAMARASVANGVSVLACTPHILPGVYNNTGLQIRTAVAKLQQSLDELAIPLRLVAGADVHIAPSLVSAIRSGLVLTLHDSRYILIELPHHVAPPRADEFFFSMLAAGYVPIFTHPERLSWMHSSYDLLDRLVRSGVWVQITAGALIGSFGKRAQYLSEKMLADGFVHIIASDTHNTQRRPPVLGEAWEAARRLVGDKEAGHLVVTRPHGILRNESPSKLPLPTPVADENEPPNYYGLKSHARGSVQFDRTYIDGDGGAGGGVLSRWMRRFF